MEDGMIRVIATVDAFPRTKEERSFSQSALHAAIVHELSDLEGVDVWVFIPPVADKCHANGTDVVLASQKIREWNNGVQDIVVTMAIQFATSSYNCVVDTYPWVEKDAMCARIPAAIQKTISNMSSNVHDPLMCQFVNVDYILPPLESIMRKEEMGIVLRDVTRVLGGKPTSILQLYEIIYICGTNGMDMSDATRVVFHRLFLG